MKTRSPLRWLVLLLSLAGSGVLLAEVEWTFDRLELSNNLTRVFLGKDVISDSEWDAQSFNSGSARQLKRVTLNLYREPNVSPSGTFWVKLYDDTGVLGSPGTNAVATIVANQEIHQLSDWYEDSVTYWGLSIPLEPGHTYFIVVGADPGASGLRWGYTNDPVGATGFPSIFTYTSDGGATWRTPFMSALPQRMVVTGDPDH